MAGFPGGGGYFFFDGVEAFDIFLIFGGVVLGLAVGLLGEGKFFFDFPDFLLHPLEQGRMPTPRCYK